MKSQILYEKHSPGRKSTKQESSPERQILRPKNFVFKRNWSLKIDLQQDRISKISREQSLQEKNFVPKLKSKQLLREPKFFFSLQRKKQKIQNSSPQFEHIKVQNPQMKGSKTKSYYSKILFQRKNSAQLKNKTMEDYFRKNSSFSRKLSSHSSQNLKEREIIDKNQFQRNFSFFDSNHNPTQLKQAKRPNLYENISFLIRRKRQMKNKNSLNKINHSKHQMTETIKSSNQVME